MGKVLADVTIMMESKDTVERVRAYAAMIKRHGKIEACEILTLATEWRALLAKDGGHTEDANIWMEEAAHWRAEAEATREEKLAREGCALAHGGYACTCGYHA